MANRRSEKEARRRQLARKQESAKMTERRERRIYLSLGAALIAIAAVTVVATRFVVALNGDWHVEALLQRAGRGGSARCRRGVCSRLNAVRGPDAGRDPLGRLSVAIRGPRSRRSTRPVLGSRL